MRNTQTFDSPLQVGDMETQTIGCRHTNPEICGKNSIQGKCAFTSKDNICRTPPASWPNKFFWLIEKGRLIQPTSENIHSSPLIKTEHLKSGRRNESHK